VREIGSAWTRFVESGELGGSAPRATIAHRWRQSRALDIDPLMERAPEGITHDEIQDPRPRGPGPRWPQGPGRLCSRGRGHGARHPVGRRPGAHRLLGGSRGAPADARPPEPRSGRVVGGERSRSERNRDADRSRPPRPSSGPSTTAGVGSPGSASAARSRTPRTGACWAAWTSPVPHELERLGRASSTPAGLSRRARAVLLMAQGFSGVAIATRTSYTVVQISRLRRRFAERA
jgi:hypothetical protein